jgi:hypothetical protein
MKIKQEEEEEVEKNYERKKSLPFFIFIFSSTANIIAMLMHKYKLLRFCYT